MVNCRTLQTTSGCPALIVSEKRGGREKKKGKVTQSPRGRVYSSSLQRRLPLSRLAARRNSPIAQMSLPSLGQRGGGGRKEKKKKKEGEKTDQRHRTLVQLGLKNGSFTASVFERPSQDEREGKKERGEKKKREGKCGPPNLGPLLTIAPISPKPAR